jgi:uncharacterized protein YrrD
MSEVKDTRDVVGLNVFSIEEGRILGKTSECVVDLATGKAIGLIVQVKAGDEMGIARSDITAVGRDAVMVSTAEVLKPLADIKGLAEHRTAGGRPAPRVLTRGGQVLGTLGVVRVDEDCREVVAYEIVGDMVQAIADGPATLPIIKGTVHGRDAIVLPEDASAAIKRPGGLRAWIEKGYDAVREAATDVSERVSSAAKKVRDSAETAEEKAVAKAKAAREAVEKKISRPEEAAAKAPPKTKPPAKAKKKAAPKKKKARKKSPSKAKKK